MRIRFHRLAALLLIPLLAFAVACTDDKPDKVDDATPQSPAAAAIEWRSCDEYDCGTLKVPLDYDKPDGQTIDLALIRLRANEPDKRIGSLLLNFGGPGGSGVENMPPWAFSAPSDIRDRFDIVSFDPRSVGKSTPIACHDDIEDLLGLDPTPDSEAEWTEVEQETRGFADLCNQRHAELLPHLGTANVVRDLDLIRAGLGDDKLTYIGYSYGTVIGALYADMFPERVRALVLDGAVDSGLTGDELALGQALGFEGALVDYVAYCRQRNCINGQTDPMAGIEALMRRVEASPLPANSGRTAGPGEVWGALTSAMYSELLWPLLTRAVNSGLDGSGNQIVQLADTGWQRRPDGSFPNLFEVYNAVTCIDYTFSNDAAHYRELASRLAAVAPHFGSGMASSSVSCAYWTPPAEPLPVVKGKGAPPILVVGTTRDPATPYAWSVGLADKLESAVLLTSRGTGHTAYLRSTICINQAVNAYLLDLKIPAEGTTCGNPEYATPIDITP